MVGLLTHTERALGSRFAALARRLNDDLGFRDQRLQFAKRSDRRGRVAWLLRSSVRVRGPSPLNSVCVIAESQNDEVSMHLSYSETWVYSSRDRLSFECSNLGFIIVSTSAGMEILPLRLEWAGRWQDASGRIVFPGQGAAHPHWQIDLEELVRHDVVGTEVSIDMPAHQTIEEIDLDGTLADRPESTYRRGGLSWVHRVHLPVRAMWHEQPCVIPNDTASHQHEPATVGEIDNWVLSAVRYLRHEFVTYA